MNPFILAVIVMAGVECAVVGLGLLLKKYFPNMGKGD